MTARILGVDVDGLTLPEAADKAMALAGSGKSAYVCTPNPEMIWLSRSDPALRDALAGADMAVADGVGVLCAAKLLGAPLPQRVTGYELMEALLAKGPGRVYFLGGKPGVAQRAAQAASRRWPGLTVAGCRDGYFSDAAPVLADIAAAEPDVILVCLGCPRQERFMAEAKTILPRGLMMGLGGSLDVLAGDVPRAPERWRGAGLEWLYRLIKQPSRIRRMPRLIGFAAAVLGEKIKRGLRRAPNV